jgi:hypothetical protein
MSREPESPLEIHNETMNRIIGGRMRPGPSTLSVQPDHGPELSSGTEMTVCKICNLPVNRYTIGEEEVWSHSRSWQRHDHDPIPTVVPANQVKLLECDFCGNDVEPYWAFHGENLRHTQGNSDLNFGSIWTACKACGELVLDNDLEALLERFMTVNAILASITDPERLRIHRADAINMWTTFLPTVTEVRYVGPRKPRAKLSPQIMPKLQLGLLRFWRNSRMFEFLNARPPGIDLSFPGVHFGDDAFERSIPSGATIPRDAWDRYTKHVCDGIEGADLYWVAPNFTKLAMHAGKDFTKLVLNRENLPSPFGFMVFAEPINEMHQGVTQPADVCAMSWTLVPGGVWFYFYAQADDGDPKVDIERMRREVGYLIAASEGVGWAFGQEWAPESSTILPTVFATFALMQQPGVADQRPGPVDTKFSRSYQRQYKRKPPEVNLVDLRAQPRRSSKPTTTGRQLEYRVFRRGHWKDQAYGPQRALRRQIYISQYIAGPDGAPFRPPKPVVKVVK